MSRVELVYDHGCPNADLARHRLAEVFDELGLEGPWTEWERNDSLAPDYVGRYGSPTILVDGRDITGEDSAVDADSCRVFPQEDGSFAGAPPLRQIIRGLRRI